MSETAFPTPLDVAQGRRRRRADDDADGPRRTLECIACVRVTDHVKGPATYDEDGSVLVQWWRCLECPDGRTVG